MCLYLYHLFDNTNQISIGLLQTSSVSRKWNRRNLKKREDNIIGRKLRRRKRKVINFMVLRMHGLYGHFNGNYLDLSVIREREREAISLKSSMTITRTALHSIDCVSQHGLSLTA
jgi:hypothetical protein